MMMGSGYSRLRQQIIIFKLSCSMRLISLRDEEKQRQYLTKSIGFLIPTKNHNGLYQPLRSRGKLRLCGEKQMLARTRGVNSRAG